MGHIGHIVKLSYCQIVRKIPWFDSYDLCDFFDLQRTPN